MSSSLPLFGLGLAALLSGVGSFGCAESAPPPAKAADEAPRKEYGPPPPKRTPGMSEARPKQIKTIEPGKVVPAFKLRTVDGDTLDSAEIVGTKPFVVMFFASWCGVCEEKLPLVQQVLAEEAGDMLVLGAALDEPETWDRVAPYIERHGLSVTLVRGQEHRGFSMAYDPFGAVPLVMVINQQGIIVDLQRGIRQGDGDRLREAVRLVRSTTL